MRKEAQEKVFTNWTVKELIGKGAFGKVYRIEREEFGTVYQAAMKKIVIPQSEEEIEDAISEGMDEGSVTGYFRSLVEEIVNEFKLMSQLKGHTNIVSYEDHLVIPHEDGIGWDILIRMELLKSLKAVTAERSLTEEEVVRLGIDMCRALEICGKMNIIHRDIKPENIFITSFGEFKLGDFGIARTAERTMSNLSKKGTYTYMAPEVYKGGAYDATVDIYSLGIVMYRFMNYNRTPFLPPYPAPISFSDREASLTRRISEEPIPAPACGSRELKRIILKACAYHPSARYQSPAQMRGELEKLLREGVADDSPRRQTETKRPGEGQNWYSQDQEETVTTAGSAKAGGPSARVYSGAKAPKDEEEDATVSMFGTKAGRETVKPKAEEKRESPSGAQEEPGPGQKSGTWSTQKQKPETQSAPRQHQEKRAGKKGGGKSMGVIILLVLVILFMALSKFGGCGTAPSNYEYYGSHDYDTLFLL